MVYIFLLLAALPGCTAPAPGAPEPAPEAPSLGSRAASILSTAIRFRTVNPPGDEAPLAAYFVDLLREAGLVRVRKDAQRRIYRLNAEGLDELGEWLESVRRFWGARLDDLERVLEDPN